MATMLIEFKDVLIEWDYEKNTAEGVDPCTLTAYSTRKAWWLCSLNHSWKATIGSRTRNGSKCPYCCNQKVLAGYNDLATLHPEVAAQWHLTKNELSAQEVGSGSKKKVWWQCDQRHEWKTTVSSRTSLKSGCPYCARIISLPGINDLATVRPGLASEWHPTKNLPLLVTDVQIGSDRNVWWQCPRGHEWKSVVRSRTKTGNGCPICTRSKTSVREMTLRYYIIKHFTPLGFQVTTGKVFNRQVDVIVKDNHGKQAHIEYDGRRWHTDAQKDVARDELLAKAEHSLGLIIRIREQGTDAYPTTGYAHIIPLVNHGRPAFIISIREVLNLLKTYFNIKEMPILIDTPDDDIAINAFIGSKVIENNLAQTHPTLAAEWHPIRNGRMLPEHLSQGSRTKAWWKCERGHEWAAQVKVRTGTGSQCPYCVGKQVWSGFNDLATTHPEVVTLWDHEKNLDFTPQDVTAGSGKKAWWKCPAGHSRRARIESMVRVPKACGICSGKTVSAGVNDLATVYPTLAAEWHPDNTLAASEVTAGSGYRARWICGKGHDWVARVVDRQRSGCPVCGELSRDPQTGRWLKI